MSMNVLQFPEGKLGDFLCVFARKVHPLQSLVARRFHANHSGVDKGKFIAPTRVAADSAARKWQIRLALIRYFQKRVDRCNWNITPRHHKNHPEIGKFIENALISFLLDVHELGASPARLVKKWQFDKNFGQNRLRRAKHSESDFRASHVPVQPLVHARNSSMRKKENRRLHF